MSFFDDIPEPPPRPRPPRHVPPVWAGPPTDELPAVISVGQFFHRSDRMVMAAKSVEVFSAGCLFEVVWAVRRSGEKDSEWSLITDQCFNRGGYRPDAEGGRSGALRFGVAFLTGGRPRLPSCTRQCLTDQRRGGAGPDDGRRRRWLGQRRRALRLQQVLAVAAPPGRRHPGAGAMGRAWYCRSVDSGSKSYRHRSASIWWRVSTGGLLDGVERTGSRTRPEGLDAVDPDGGRLCAPALMPVGAGGPRQSGVRTADPEQLGRGIRPPHVRLRTRWSPWLRA